MTRTQTLVVIAGLCASMTGMTILCVLFRADRVCVALCAALLLLLIAGRIFGHHEALLFLRRVQRVGQVLASRSSLFANRLAEPAPSWSAAVESFRRHGVTRLELYCVDQRTDAAFDHRSWAATEDGVAAWELRVSARMADRRRLSILAFGEQRHAAASQLAELFGLLDACCHAWAMIGGPPEEPVVPSHPHQVPRPKLLPLDSAEPARRAA